MPKYLIDSPCGFCNTHNHKFVVKAKSFLEAIEFAVDFVKEAHKADMLIKAELDMSDEKIEEDYPGVWIIN